jgi:hypothetical protein
MGYQQHMQGTLPSTQSWWRWRVCFNRALASSLAQAAVVVSCSRIAMKSQVCMVGAGAWGRGVTEGGITTAVSAEVGWVMLWQRVTA